MPAGPTQTLHPRSAFYGVSPAGSIGPYARRLSLDPQAAWGAGSCSCDGVPSVPATSAGAGTVFAGWTHSHDAAAQPPVYYSVPSAATFGPMMTPILSGVPQLHSPPVTLFEGPPPPSVWYAAPMGPAMASNVLVHAAPTSLSLPGSVPLHAGQHVVYVSTPNTSVPSAHPSALSTQPSMAPPPYFQHGPSPDAVAMLRTFSGPAPPGRSHPDPSPQRSVATYSTTLPPDKAAAVEALRAEFTAMDTDGDGLITPFDYACHVSAATGTPLPIADAHQRMRETNPDFVVSLDFNGFLRMSALLKSTGQSQLDQRGGPHSSDSLPTQNGYSHPVREIWTEWTPPPPPSLSNPHFIVQVPTVTSVPQAGSFTAPSKPPAPQPPTLRSVPLQSSPTHSSAPDPWSGSAHHGAPLPPPRGPSNRHGSGSTRNSRTSRTGRRS
eukprot:TRINITY_DN5330_c0_g1_i2.p1 TRINITY_DN5330_c0_g1~~TRINITY_DN5330_c0_g1_i2.p1  ORF type:complete len:437 (-),score=29.50 TRINITY_DN5330_c0_g1_i2:242-1552(-)